MPLSECMQRTTSREYDAWNKWLDDQLWEPSRSDLYIMQLTAQVANILSKKTFNLHDFRLQVKKKLDKQTPEDITASKSRWKDMLGMTPKKQSKEQVDKSHGKLGI